ncbi:MAG: hypothetical protein K2Q01_10700, partial [Rickettsiales bacterium]|nr:hypothetical protein [Rickettsiales bacterium]
PVIAAITQTARAGRVGQLETIRTQRGQERNQALVDSIQFADPSTKRDLNDAKTAVSRVQTAWDARLDGMFVKPADRAKIANLIARKSANSRFRKLSTAAQLTEILNTRPGGDGTPSVRDMLNDPANGGPAALGYFQTAYTETAGPVKEILDRALGGRDNSLPEADLPREMTISLTEKARIDALAVTRALDLNGNSVLEAAEFTDANIATTLTAMRLARTRDGATGDRTLTDAELTDMSPEDQAKMRRAIAAVKVFEERGISLDGPTATPDQIRQQLATFGVTATAPATPPGPGGGGAPLPPGGTGGPGGGPTRP